MTITKRLKIGDVSDLLKIPAYVLRYWETEFPELKPDKSRAGQRLYDEKEIAFIKKIADLRYNEKLTISGCKTRLKQEKIRNIQKHVISDQTDLILEKINVIKKGLQEVLEELG
jgi:DNA-binding transcriptional MerR regulator